MTPPTEHPGNPSAAQRTAARQAAALVAHYHRADDDALDGTLTELATSEDATRLVHALIALARYYARRVHGTETEAELAAYALALAAAEAADAQ